MPRKPRGPQAMTAAERKREQRARDRTSVMEQDDREWSERVCVMVLQSPDYGDALKRAAWEQLGRLKGWLT